MSWLSGLTNSIGSIFGNGSLGDDIAGIFDPEDLVGGIFDSSGNPSADTTIKNPFGNIGSALNGLGGSGNTGVSMWPQIIGAGTQLAGQYFGQSNNKENAEAYAQSVANQIEAQKAENALERENQQAIARIGAAASAGNARKSTLASLYNNWATNTAQGGANQAQSAIGAGKAITDGINARAAVLR